MNLNHVNCVVRVSNLEALGKHDLLGRAKRLGFEEVSVTDLNYSRPLGVIRKRLIKLDELSVDENKMALITKVNVVEQRGVVAKVYEPTVVGSDLRESVSVRLHDHDDEHFYNTVPFSWVQQNYSFVVVMMVSVKNFLLVSNLGVVYWGRVNVQPVRDDR